MIVILINPAAVYAMGPFHQFRHNLSIEAKLFPFFLSVMRDEPIRI
jgi:hypothetical protein